MFKKRRDRIAGYIVLDEHGRPLYIGYDNVLWVGSYGWGATMFKSRRMAQSAIDRTNKYFEEETSKNIVSVRENA